MGHDSLENHYKSNFALMHHHKWSITELENMMPWERHIYIDLLEGHIKAEEEKMRDLEQQRRTNSLKRFKM